MIEGPLVVREALAAGVEVAEAFIVPDAHPALVSELERSGKPVHLVTAEVMARAVDTVTPQGVAVIARRPEVPLSQAIAAAASGTLTLVLVDVADPGNAGTLLRAAEAAGAAAVLFCGTSVDPCNPKCVRASAGALFHVPVSEGGEAVAVLDQLGTVGVTTLSTVVRDGTPYDQVDLTGPVAVVLGSEAHGLPDEVLARVGGRITIPMTGRSESLNVAMAGSILCFESLRQRRSGR